MGDTVKCVFCGTLEDWEDFHVWGCEVCNRVFCDDCAPEGSNPLDPHKLIRCPACAAKQESVNLGCSLCQHGQGGEQADPEKCVACIRCGGLRVDTMWLRLDNFQPAMLALPA